MSFDTWLLFCITEFVLCLSPGPAVLYVLSQGLGSGFRASVAANSGIVFGNTIYFVVSATGLGAILVASENIFFVAKWVGTVYLVWLGINYLISKPYELAVEKSRGRSLYKIFHGGLILQLANPKNIVFFMAILPQFISIEHSVPMQILILGVSSVIIEVSILLFYGALGSKIEKWARDKDWNSGLSKISGVALICVGISIALIQQSKI